jgi:Arc/MetJ-type ribon-helix-helix transcriptional regulator
VNIRLKPDAEAYLKAQVTSGRFTSIEDAIEALTRDDEVAQAEIDAADISWAKPYLGKGRLSDIEAGQTVPAETVHAELRDRFRIKRD